MKTIILKVQVPDGRKTDDIISRIIHYQWEEITLPSEEEIKEAMTTEHYHYETGRHKKVRLDRIQGAIWLLNKLKS